MKFHDDHEEHHSFESNYTNDVESHDKARIRRLLEEKLDEQRLRRELKDDFDELNEDFDWDDYK
jgi:hypothetical protein